jgi:hypothetical protein
VLLLLLCLFLVFVVGANRGVLFFIKKITGQPLNETMCGCRDQDQNTIGQCPCVGLTVRGNMLVVLDSTAAANQVRVVLFQAHQLII